MPAKRTSRLIIGCGYLGRRVARRWIEVGDDVAALTRSHTRANEFLAEGIRPVVGDVLEPETLIGLPEAQTVLYAVGYDRAGDASKRMVYVDGLRHVLAALPDTVERLIYVSSTSVYGQSNGEWVNEMSPCEPTTDGGRICLDAERVLHENRRRALSLQVLRLSGIYGPGRLIARLDALRAQRPLPGNADAWLNLIHVADAANTVISAAERASPESDTVLVCDDRPVRRRRYYEMLARLAGTPAPVFQADDRTKLEFGKRCDNQRLHDLLGQSLAFPTIDEGLPNALHDTG